MMKCFKYFDTKARKLTRCLNENMQRPLCFADCYLTLYQDIMARWHTLNCYHFISNTYRQKHKDMETNSDLYSISIEKVVNRNIMFRRNLYK